jgi:hypothetical protein
MTEYEKQKKEEDTKIPDLEKQPHSKPKIS